MKDKHIKHPPLKRPNPCNYHPMEWALYGTTCGEIKSIFSQIEQELAPFRLTYIDADHSDEAISTTFQIGKKQFHQNQPLNWGRYDDRLYNWPVDAAIINGNHYPASRQIVVINTKKKDSLHRRLDQLDNIELVIFTENDQEIYDFIEEKLNEDIPRLHISEIKKIAQKLQHKIESERPPLKALILAGGKSKRMGSDKAQMNYHGNTSQVRHLGELCAELGMEVFVSRSPTEKEEKYDGFPVIKDRLTDMGPFGAIVSAFIHDPTSAYLVLACDLPLVTKESLQRLVGSRNMTKYGTAYRLKDQKFPEPLIAIYEPKIYQRMMRLFTLGYACPRKVLINSEIEILELEEASVAFNANTQEDRDKALKIIQASMK